MSNTGVVSGTPNASGEFTFPVTVANSEGNMTKSYQMNVKKGTRDLTWGQTIAGLTYGDANFSLSATSTNVGGITYGSSDESIVEINGTLKTQHTLEDGLVWYWNFDEDLNGTSNPVNATIGGLNGTLRYTSSSTPGTSLSLTSEKPARSKTGLIHALAAITGTRRASSGSQAMTTTAALEDRTKWKSPRPPSMALT